MDYFLGFIVNSEEVCALLFRNHQRACVFRPTALSIRYMPRLSRHVLLLLPLDGYSFAVCLLGSPSRIYPLALPHQGREDIAAEG